MTEEAPMITVSITPAIANEYTTRDLRDVPRAAGIHRVSPALAKGMLEDAEFNADVEMPVGVQAAYRALARQLRRAISADGGET